MNDEFNKFGKKELKKHKTPFIDYAKCARLKI